MTEAHSFVDSILLITYEARQFQFPQARDVLRLSHSPLGTSEPISNLSLEEQSRMLALADQALHNFKGDDSRLRAGDRAHDDHERLKKELRAAVARFEHQRKIWQRLK